MLPETEIKPKISLLVKIKNAMSKNISTTSFIFSMLVILLLGSAFFLALHFYLNPKQIPVTFQNYQPVTTLPVSLTLDLSNPDDNLLVFDSSLLVSGKTVTGALIIITLNNQNQLLTANPDGYFSQTVKLSPQVNQLSVSAFDNLGNYKSEQRTIYFSEEKL